jgi:hypothetical protein
MNDDKVSRAEIWGNPGDIGRRCSPVVLHYILSALQEQPAFSFLVIRRGVQEMT